MGDGLQATWKAKRSSMQILKRLSSTKIAGRLSQGGESSRHYGIEHEGDSAEGGVGSCSGRLGGAAGSIA